MEIASNSKALHLFPQGQRAKTNHVGCRRIDFSTLDRNPNRSKTSSQTYRNRKEEERHGLVSTLKKRNKFCEEEDKASNKRQKRTTEHNSTTTKVCSVFRSQSSQNSFESRVTTRVDPKVVSKTEKSITVSKVRRSSTFHQETKTKPSDGGIESHGCSLRDLIAKAKNKVEEKRQIDGRREYIASKRLEAHLAKVEEKRQTDDRREYMARKRLEERLAISRMVTTIAADDHLGYHIELEKLGCTFIHDQVVCLTKFSLRIGSCDKSTSSFLGETESAESTNRAKGS